VRCAQREASQREEGLREDYYWSTGCIVEAEVAGRDEQKWQVSCKLQRQRETLHGGGRGGALSSRGMGFRLRGTRRVGLSLRSMGDDGTTDAATVRHTVGGHYWAREAREA
jgi:hypothetical protein